MDAQPEENPKERLEIVHEGMAMAPCEYINNHECLCTSLARRSRCYLPLDLDCKVEINQES